MKKLGLDPAEPPTAEQWSLFLDRVGRAYEEADQDRYLLERSQDIASGEMQALYKRILALNAELEQRVRERTRQLEAANHELEAFSYSVSHDLRAPLRAINGFASVLLDKFAQCGDEETRDSLERITRGSVRMGEIIDDLLDLARLGRAEVHAQPTDLSRMADAVLAELAAVSPRRTETTVEEGIVVEADPRLLRILLENLLSNAWKYSAKQECARVTVGCRWAGGERILFVQDNGAGFDMDHAGKLFAPFGRLHDAREFEGTGIGLAIAHRIVERHGGRIWAEAAPGQGATFHFTLGSPSAQPQAASEERIG